MLYRSVHGWGDPAKDKWKAVAQPAHPCTHSLSAAWLCWPLGPWLLIYLRSCFSNHHLSDQVPSHIRFLLGKVTRLTPVTVFQTHSLLFSPISSVWKQTAT